MPRDQLVPKLSPWTDALRGHLSLSVDDAAPHRTELLEKLWVQLTVPVGAHIRWIQALQLLGVLFRVDRRACWDLIVDLCDAREKLRTLGCPLEFLVAVRPRFELRFDQHVQPTDEIVAFLLSGGEADDRVGEADDRVTDRGSFSQMETTILATTDDSDIRVPLPLRFGFFCRTCNGCRAGFCRVNLTSYTKQVLASASRIAKLNATRTTTRCTVESFGFDSVGRDLKLLREIACQIPLHAMPFTHCWESWDDNMFGPFLWRLLAPHDNVRAHLGLRSFVIDASPGHATMSRDGIAALCSAISSSRTLEELSFEETTDNKLRGTMWSAWLAFALFSKASRHQIHTADLTMGAGFPTYVEAVKQTIDHESSRPTDHSTYPIQWPPATIRVNASSKIYGFELPKASRATTVYHGKRTVECLQVSQDYGSSARVVIPGVGIGCVARTDVLSEQPAKTRETHPIRNLTLTVKSCIVEYALRQFKHCLFDTASVLAFLQLVGEPLVQLTLVCRGLRPAASLRIDDILASCPHLKSLKVVNLTLSADQLFASRHGQALQSLTLLSCNLLDKPRAVGCGAYVAPFTFPRLTSLYVDSTGGDASSSIPELASVHDYVLGMAIQRNLHRLVVKCRDAKQRARYAAHVERQDGELIPVLPLRKKLAFLSVVTAGLSASSSAKFNDGCRTTGV